jgi:amino acid adenylation domain-containing protein
LCCEALGLRETTFDSNFDDSYRNKEMSTMNKPALLGDEPCASRPVFAISSTDLDTSLPLPELIAAQARRHGNAPAVVDRETAITYARLDASANRLAHRLKSLGLKRESLVAICTERSTSLVSAALAAWKAGAAYLPLDPNYPAERLRAILQDSAADLVITDGAVSNCVSDHPRVLVLDPDRDEREGCPAEAPEGKWSHEQLAYVIYTSGSTGRPKGVQITHDNLMNLIRWHRQAFNVTRHDRAMLQSSPAFDASVWEIWPYLCVGACLFRVDYATKADPERLRDWLVEKSITISFVPTTIAESLMRLDWPGTCQLRFLLTGADILTQFPSADLPFTVVNNYGPTECTVVSTSGAVKPERSSKQPPSLGRPILNTSVYLLNSDRKPVAAGEVGEIYIGGQGVGRGYVNNPQMTQDRFIPDPFSPGSNQRLYRSGDLARYTPNGEVAFVGRADDQLKIRGFRIEPAEIMAALNRHPEVKTSYVHAFVKNPGEKALIAYLVLEANTRLGHRAMQDFLRQLLPEYMIPAIFVTVSSLPITSNGKVDRDRLPHPDETNTLTDPVLDEARTLVQEKLVSIVSGLLNLQNVGIHENFFFLGGNSLLGTQIIASVRDTFDVDLSLLTLFEGPTVAQLSAEIEQSLYARLEDIAA